jgi:SAM-dependent methyltransferase
MYHVLIEKQFLRSELKGNKRCLQLAPEKVTYNYIYPTFGSGYITSDLVPKRYPHAKCLKFALPDDFVKIPDEYFYLILHNHVLEHIPGKFTEHIDEFHRVLEKDGAMVFTIPDEYIMKGIVKSVEGGEHLSSDKDRLKNFGQGDHYKWLGLDFIEYLKTKFSTVELLADRRNQDSKELIDKHNAWGIVFFCQK